MSKDIKSLVEAVESKGEGIVIPMLNPKDLQVKMSAVVPPAYLDALECDRRWSERFEKQCAEVVEQNKDALDFEDADRFEGNKPAIADKAVKIESSRLTEDTHASTARPEGDKVKAYNNALKYAKRDGVPYCYGYSNSRLQGKFFAFDQPFKWDGDDKAFRAQYKNTSVIYVAYPDKSFIEESLTEDTIKLPNGKWANKGDEGAHGEFKTKKEADAQRRAMYANGYKESLTEAAEEPAENEEEAEPEAVVKVALKKFKPWGNAVDTYKQIIEADKLKDLERALEVGWSDGIEDQTLNELLSEDKDWLAEVLDMEFTESKGE